MQELRSTRYCLPFSVQLKSNITASPPRNWKGERKQCSVLDVLEGHRFLQVTYHPPACCCSGRQFSRVQDASLGVGACQSARPLKSLSYCEAARVNTMTGSLDLSFGFPRNGKIPHPHQVTWSQPINMLPVGNKGRAEKPAKVCTNKIALQTCSQSA